MKKPILRIYFLLLLTPLLLVGCSEESREPSPYEEVNTLDGIWIEVKEDTLTPNGLEIVFHNTTERDDYFYGAWYVLEKHQKEHWFSVNALPDAVRFIEDWARRLLPEEEMEQKYSAGKNQTDLESYPPNEMSYDWKGYYGELPSGEYRIVIYLLSDFDRPIQETSPRYYLSANFSIE